MVLRVALAGAGALWSLLTLPLVAADWSWPVVKTISGWMPYAAIADAVGDPYTVFGILGSLSFLAIGIALLPTLWRAGWGGRVFAVSILLGALATALSYAGTPEDSPLHALWGVEGYALVLIGLAGIPAAITAGPRWPAWCRVLVGAPLPVLALGMLALGYYPNGCLVLLGVEAVAVIAATDRTAARPAGTRVWIAPSHSV